MNTQNVQKGEDILEILDQIFINKEYIAEGF